MFGHKKCRTFFILERAPAGARPLCARAPGCKRNGFGKKFSDLKKKLEKNYNPDKPRNRGYRQGYFRWRCTDKDSNLKVTIQKDSKVMLYLDNFLSSSETISMQRYQKETKQSEQIDF